MLRSNATVSRRGLSTVLLFSLLLMLRLLSPALCHAQTWSSTAASDNWSVGTNWTGGVAPVSGGLPVFAASSRLTTNNDITGLSTVGITFSALAGAYVVSGNLITLGGDLTDSTTAQINFNAPLLINSLRTFNVTNAAGDLVVGSVVSGTNSGVTMAKAGKGSLTFTNANTYTGLTDIQDGMLTLSGLNGSLVLGTGLNISNGATLRLLNTAAASNANRIADTQPIGLASGNILFSHTGGAANYSETTGVLTLTSGLNTVTTFQADAGQTSALTFASLTRNGGVINFAGTGLGDDTRNRIVFTSAPNNDGIMGGYATVGNDFAKYDATLGSVRAMQAADYVTIAQNTWASASNVMITGSTVLSANRQINSLNIAAAAPTIADLGNNTLRVESGGVMLSGASAINIQHGTLTAGEGTNAAGSLYLHQNSSAVLTIGARITNNGSGAVTLVKAGTGSLNLAEANTYTGATFVYAGTLRNMVTNTLPTTTGLTLGDASGTAASLDATGVSQSLSSLSVLGNTTTVHAITVTAGETMTVNGAVNIGANVYATTTNTTFLGGGTLTVNNPAGLIQLGLATGNINYNSATLDLSGLSTVNINLGTTGTSTTSVLRIGDNNSTSGSGAATLKLAPNTTITALRISLGAETGNGANQTLALGTGTNVLNTGTLDMGSSNTFSGARGIGVVNFLSTTNGTLKLRGVDGTSATSALNVGYSTLATTSGTLGAVWDTRGHNADILVTALNIGGRTTGTGISNTTFDFDKGILTAATTVIGMKGSANTNALAVSSIVTFGGGVVSLGNVTMATNGSGSGAAVGTAAGTLNISGGTVTLTSLAMASTSNVTGTATGTFNLTGGDVTLNGAITRIGGAGTNNAVVNLNGATLDMKGNAIGSGTSAVTFNAQSGILKNMGAINGTAGLTKTGTGTLELQGSNVYAGPTTVSLGILKVATISDGGAASTLGSSASDAAGLVLNGGTLQYVGATGSSNRLFSVGTTAGSALDASGTGPLSLGTAGAVGLSGTGTRTLTLTGTNTGDNLLAASLGDDGANASSLTKTGTGTWVLTGTHSYTGLTTVNGGTLRLDFSGAGAPGSNIIGSNSGLALGGGTLAVKAASGSPTQAFASLAVNVGASVLSTSPGGATSLTVNFGGASIARSAGGTVNFQPSATNSFTATNAVNNSAGILGGYALVNGTDWAARDGSGNITALAAYTPLTTAATSATTANYSLSGGQTQAGAVSVNSLKLIGTGTLAMGGNALTFTGAAGGLLYAPAGGSDTYNITGSAVVGSGTTSEFIVSVNQGTLNIANPLVSSTATAGSMTKAGAGTLVYTGTSAYTGATWVNGGVLEISGTGTINSATGSVIVAPAGTLRVNSSNAAGAVADAAAVTVAGTLEVRANETIGGLAGSGTVTNKGSVNAVLTANSSGTTTNFSGVLQDGSTGTLGLAKSGTGTLTLSGTTSNLNTGVTTVTAGTLSLAKTGGALAISGNVLVGDGLVAADILLLNGSEQIANTSLVTITGSTFSGVLRLNGNTETIGGLSTTGSTPNAATVDNALGATTGKLILNNAVDADFGGVISNGTGTGSVLALTKTGTAQQTLSGSTSNTFTGGITVLAGTLRLNKTAGVNAVPSGTLVVGDGTAAAVVQWAAGNQIVDTVVPVLAGTGANAGVLRLFGRVETIGGLSSNPTLGGGVVENELGSVGTGTLTLSLAANTSQTFTGILRDGDGTGIDGTLAIVKSGAGVQVFTNDNTYSGGTTISAGTLVIGNGGATGTLGSGAIANNGTLVIDRTGSLTIGAGQAITGTGSLVLGGSQTLTLSGTANTYSGDTIIDQGTLVVTNASGSATGTGNVLVANTAMLAGTGIVGGAVTVNLGGVLTVGNLSGDSTGKVLQINGSLGSLGTLSFDLWDNAHGTNPLTNADLLKFGGSSVGAFDLGGTLSVNGNGINNWQAGDQWQIFDWGSIAPADRNVNFTTLNLPTLTGGLSFDLSALATTGYISIVAIPEPSRAVLCLLGLVGMMARRRRSKCGRPSGLPGF